jgi:hypothetical protein
VAMKHVREEIPDVQSKRPEVSAALAAVLETTTAKRESDRYADDTELIADLEDVLGLETARAGSVTGEVTTVLRTLPSTAQRRVPLRLRHRVVVAGMLLVVAAVAAAVIAFLVPRTHHGAPPLPQAAPKPTPHQVTLCNSCAHDYNPDALSGPKDQHPNTVGLAIDGDRNSSWTTESYLNDDLGKPGVGLYVDAKPGVAAGSLVIDTETPGYAVSIYARHNAPDLNTFDTSWVKVGSAANVHRTQPIRLHTNGTRYRYYLVWITSLGNHNQVAINEIALYRR